MLKPHFFHKHHNLSVFLEKTYVVFALLALGKAFKTILSAHTSNEGKSTVLLAVTFLMFIPLVIKNRRVFLEVFFLDKWLIFIVGFVLASTIWSSSPFVTLRYGLTFLGGTLFGIYLAARFSLKEQMKLYAIAFAIAATLSFIMCILLPNIGVGSSRITNAWKGIFPHKNSLGRLMAVSTILFWLLMRLFPERKVLLAGMAGLSAVLVVLSRSATSLIALSLGIAVAQPILIWHRNRKLGPLLISGSFLLALILGFSIYLNIDLFFQFFGRDPNENTLVGRVYLWSELAGLIAEKKLMGYGYNAFWMGWDGPSALIWQHFGWKPNHAHNGFVDICLNLGLLGLLIIITHVVRSLFIALQEVKRRTENKEAFWVFTYITFLLFANCTYSILVSQSVFFWVLYVTLTLSLLRSRNRLEISAFDAGTKPQRHQRSIFTFLEKIYLKQRNKS